MNRMLRVTMATLLGAIAGFWLSAAMTQVQPSTTITKRAQKLPDTTTVSPSSRITAEQQPLPLETRVAILEREVATLRTQVGQLIARASGDELRLNLPLREPGTAESKDLGIAVK